MIKKAFYILIPAVMIVVSCQSDKKGKEREIPQVRTPDVTAESPEAARLPWTAVVNPQSGKMEIKTDPDTKPAISAQEVVEAANIKYPQIRLELVNIKGATVYVKIENAKHLTQEMGSTGAQVYLAEVTYSLTEVKNITAVNFSFTEGEHASPGTLNRDDFADFN